MSEVAAAADATAAAVTPTDDAAEPTREVSEEGVKRKAEEETPGAEDETASTGPKRAKEAVSGGEGTTDSVSAPAAGGSASAMSAFGKISSLGQAVFGKSSSTTLPVFGKASSVGSASWTKTKFGSGSSTGFGSTSKGFGSFGSGVSGFGGIKKPTEATEATEGEDKNKAETAPAKVGFGSATTGAFTFKAKTAAGAAGVGESKVFSVSSGKATIDQPKKTVVLLKGATEATGEEADKHVLKMRARLYCSVESGGTRAWQEQGTGQLTINDKIVDGERVRSRIVMRQDSNRLVLNAQIWTGLNPEKVTARALRVTATNHATTALNGATNAGESPTNQIFLIKVGPKEIEQLVTCINLRVDSCKNSA